MNEKYTFKQILFGLKEEYLLIQEQLSTLKKYIDLEENNLRDIEFSLSSNYDDNKIKLLCTLYDKISFLEARLEEIKIKLGIFPNYRISYINEIEDRYSIEKYPEIINDKKNQEFSQSVFYILNTDFAKNAKFIYYGTGYSGIPFLSISPSSIYINESNYISVDFIPTKGNYINLYSYKGRLTEEKIKEVFNISFSKQRFPKYYQNLINNSTSFDKSLEIIGDLGYSKKGKFELIEDSKKLILKKK